jgi:hypothetical protein
MPSSVSGSSVARSVAPRTPNRRDRRALRGRGQGSNRACRRRWDRRRRSTRRAPVMRRRAWRRARWHTRAQPESCAWRARSYDRWLRPTPRQLGALRPADHSSRRPGGSLGTSRLIGEEPTNALPGCQVYGPGRDATLCPDEFEAHFAQLACVRRAERGRPDHRVTRLGGACRLDLNPNCRRSRPVVLQITLELAVRQRGCLRLGRRFYGSRPLGQRKRSTRPASTRTDASPDTSGRGGWRRVPPQAAESGAERMARKAGVLPGLLRGPFK